jgi:hypothetical protein
MGSERGRPGSYGPGVSGRPTVARILSLQGGAQARGPRFSDVLAGEEVRIGRLAFLSAGGGRGFEPDAAGEVAPEALPGCTSVQ